MRVRSVPREEGQAGLATGDHGIAPCRQPALPWGLFTVTPDTDTAEKAEACVVPPSVTHGVQCCSSAPLLKLLPLLGIPSYFPSSLNLAESFRAFKSAVGLSHATFSSPTASVTEEQGLCLFILCPQAFMLGLMAQSQLSDYSWSATRSKALAHSPLPCPSLLMPCFLCSSSRSPSLPSSSLIHAWMCPL